MMDSRLDFCPTRNVYDTRLDEVAMKLSKAELVAILAVCGISTQAVGAAQPQDNGAMSAVDHSDMTLLGGKDSACGAGSCGADEKGAEAAKKKHGGDKKEEKKSDKKADSKEKSDKK